MNEQAQEIHARLEACRVEFVRESVRLSVGTKAVDSQSWEMTRVGQARTAINSPATRFAEYRQARGEDLVRLVIGVTEIEARHNFVLVLVAFGTAVIDCEVFTALRLYGGNSEDAEGWMADPGRALATFLARFGEDYEIERGEMSRFSPLVDLEPERFVGPDSVELAEITEALGFDFNPEALTLMTVHRVKKEGGAVLFFPMMIKTDAYLADVKRWR